jgi:antitoxin HicB
MMNGYSVVIQWSEEDDGYIATIPELSGISAFGVTREEALQELEVAKDAYLEVFKEDSRELPAPDTLNSFSGQTRIRLPKGLHASLSREAKMEGVSLNTYIVHLLSERNIGHRIERKIDLLEDAVQNPQVSQQGLYYVFNTGYDQSPDIEQTQEQDIAPGSGSVYQNIELIELEDKKTFH